LSRGWIRETGRFSGKEKTKKKLLLTEVKVGEGGCVMLESGAAEDVRRIGRPIATANFAVQQNYFRGDRP
jgi:hypothetical protein